MEEILDRLISIVQDTAPAVWAIARRQVMSNVAEAAIWGMFLLACVVLLALLAKYFDKRRRTDEDYNSYAMWDVAETFSIAFAVLMLFIAVGQIGSVTKYLINPEYYAIKVLLDLIG